jgi:hypothetical protein
LDFYSQCVLDGKAIKFSLPRGKRSKWACR